jgi:hypothetical protein
MCACVYVYVCVYVHLVEVEVGAVVGRGRGVMESWNRTRYARRAGHAYPRHPS